MIDDKKIEEAKDNIFNKHFLKNNEEVVCINHISEPVYLDYQIKQAIGLGAKWMQEEFLKDLWHSYDEVPTRKDKDILQFFESYSADSEDDYDEYFELAHTREGFTQETWEDFMNIGGTPSMWLYIEDLFPRKEVNND